MNIPVLLRILTKFNFPSALFESPHEGIDSYGLHFLGITLIFYHNRAAGEHWKDFHLSWNWSLSSALKGKSLRWLTGWRTLEKLCWRGGRSPLQTFVSIRIIGTQAWPPCYQDIHHVFLYLTQSSLIILSSFSHPPSPPLPVIPN